MQSFATARSVKTLDMPIPLTWLSSIESSVDRLNPFDERMHAHSSIRQKYVSSVQFISVHSVRSVRAFRPT